MIDIKQLSTQLKSYGLNENESRVYLFLLRQAGEFSVVQIARTLKLGRTPVYNSLDRLEAKGLVRKVIAENGSNYVAATPDHLDLYWKRKINGVRNLGAKLPDLVSALEAMTATSGYKSKVDYFTGRRGLEQITYHSLKAKGDLYIYEMIESMDPFMSKESAEEYRRVWAERGTVIHQMTNSREFEEFTEIEELIGDLWDVRYIASEVLAIKFEMLIYNDVVALYSAVGEEIFGVEIHNKSLAVMQKQIFMAMQHLAKPLKKVNARGKAHL